MTALVARVYTRISEEDKDTPDTTINNQKNYGVSFISNQGWLLDPVKPFYEAINEKSWKPLKERKILNQALEEMKNGDYDVLVVKTWTRFARGRMQQDLEFLFKEAGGKVVPVMGSQDEIGKEAESFASGLIIKQNRREAYKLQKQKEQEGLPRGGPAPFGYKYGKTRIKKGTKWITASDGHWHINEKEAQIIKDIFNMKAQKIHISEISKKHNINRKQIYRILNRKEYLGHITFIKKIRDPNGNIVRTEQIEYKGIHKPIIDIHTWNQVHKN